MPQDEEHGPAAWFEYARSDLEAADALRERYPRQAAFLLQQAIEKGLKGFLLQRGWELKRIHDLDTLLDEAVEHDDALERFRPVTERVTLYYLGERYPGVEGYDPRRGELEEQIGSAAELLSALEA